MEGNYRVCFVLLCIWGQFPSTSPPGGAYIWGGRFDGGCFALRVQGGLIFGGAYFRNFTVLCSNAWRSLHHHIQICKGKCMWRKQVPKSGLPYGAGIQTIAEFFFAMCCTLCLMLDLVIVRQTSTPSYSSFGEFLLTNCLLGENSFNGHYDFIYYSFKIFHRLWLAQIHWLILHRLLLNNVGQKALGHLGQFTRHSIPYCVSFEQWLYWFGLDNQGFQ